MAKIWQSAEIVLIIKEIAKDKTTKLIAEGINRNVVTEIGDSDKIVEISFVNRLRKTYEESLEQQAKDS